MNKPKHPTALSLRLDRFDDKIAMIEQKLNMAYLAREVGRFLMTATVDGIGRKALAEGEWFKAPPVQVRAAMKGIRLTDLAPRSFEELTKGFSARDKADFKAMARQQAIITKFDAKYRRAKRVVSKGATAAQKALTDTFFFNKPIPKSMLKPRKLAVKRTRKASK